MRGTLKQQARAKMVDRNEIRRCQFDGHVKPVTLMHSEKAYSKKSCWNFVSTWRPARAADVCGWTYPEYSTHDHLIPGRLHRPGGRSVVIVYPKKSPFCHTAAELCICAIMRACMCRADWSRKAALRTGGGGRGRRVARAGA